MQFNMDRCKTLSLGKRRGNINYRLENGEINNSASERGLGALVSRATKTREHCISVWNEATRILGFRPRGVSNRSADVTLYL